jgi:hypothetical protein
MAVHVAGNHGVGHIQDGLGGAVVPLQQDDAGLRIVLAKAGHVAIVGAAKAIDRLVLVAHDKEVGPAAGQELDQLVLGHVGVLPLVDEDKGIALPGTWPAPPRSRKNCTALTSRSSKSRALFWASSVS